MPLEVVHTRGSRHDVAQPIGVRENGTLKGLRGNINFTSGATLTDDSTNDEVEVAIAVTTSQRLRAYPTLAAGVTLTSSTTGYLPGSYAEIAAANGITSAFAIEGLAINNISNTASEYIVELATGAASSEVVIAEFPGLFFESTGRGIYLPLLVPIAVAANTRVAARLATSGTSARTAIVRFMYRHTPF